MFTLKQILASSDVKGQMQMILDMIEDEDNKDISQGLNIWAELKDGLAFYKDWEMTFRKALDKKCFPNPKMGTNMTPLKNGYMLTSQHKLSYKLDEAMFPWVREQLAAQNLSLDDYLKVKYELDIKAYGAVVQVESKTEAKPVGQVLREMITTTPAAPTLAIVTPKDAK